MLEKDTISPSLKNIQKKLDKLAEEAYRVWLANTPKRSGNARQQTRLNGDEIQANYAYAKKLDDGYSPKSPKGMSRPTYDYVKTRSKQIMRK